MNNLQDLICDRLVGATVGPHWVGGPLHVAALAIDPSFVPAARGDSRPGQFARAVGWPVLFCEAVVGATAGLRDEDARRALAITLFGRVPPARPGRRNAPVPGGVSRPAMAWAVLRGHESACGTDCPLHAFAVEALQAAEAGRRWPGLFRGGADCRSAPRSSAMPVTPRSSPAHHAAVAMRYLNDVMRDPKNHHALADALRESAKAEAKTHGPAAAAAFCVVLADRFGLAAPDRSEARPAPPPSRRPPDGREDPCVRG